MTASFFAPVFSLRNTGKHPGKLLSLRYESADVDDEKKGDACQMIKCKITVLKREFYKDLADEYVPVPDFGPCHMMKEGDVFITGGPFGNQMPEGFCDMAWQAICIQASTLAGGGKVFGHDDVHIACCNDGVRPVVFRLEAIEDGQEQSF